MSSARFNPDITRAMKNSNRQHRFKNWLGFEQNCSFDSSGSRTNAASALQARSNYESRFMSSNSVSASSEALPTTGKVSVILPVYNEQACIESTFDKILEYAHTHPNYDFLFVDDGSTDWTKQFLKMKLNTARTKQIQLLSYQSNLGKGRAIQRGVNQVSGDYICYLDSDLAYSLEHLDQLIAALQDCDMVIGCRSLASSRVKGQSLTRKVAGKLFNLLSRSFLNLPYRDMQAGLKGFKRHPAKVLFSKQKMMGFSFDVELIYLAREYGYSIQEIPATVSAYHPQKQSKVNLILDSMEMLFDVVEIKINDLKGIYD
jgi:dolichyl-phosphate beta-glucosyltransferase